MDDENGESMEPILPMEEVPLKELGETESGASRSISDNADCVFTILRGELRMLLVNRVLKTNGFRECALKIALTRSTKYRLAALGELTAHPRPLSWI